MGNPIGTSTNFPQGFANGISVRGMPLLQMQPGQVYFVGNSTVLNPNQRAGSDGNRGTFLDPFATLNYAVNTACTASRGDIVFVLPGHAETISSATILTLATAGVAVVGLGSGTLRPTFTFTTAVTANIPVSAANISIQNCLFVANFADVASVFTATGTAAVTDFSIDNCEFRDSSNVLNFLSVFTGNATANTMDGFNFTRNIVSSSGTTAATTAIIVGSATARMNVSDNTGVWAVLNNTACLIAGGANNLTFFSCYRNRVTRPNTTTVGGMMISSSSTACTGIVADNYAWHLAATGLLIATGTKLAFVQNFCSITGAADKSALLNPVAV